MRIDLITDYGLELEMKKEKKRQIFDVLLGIYDFYLGILFGSMRQWYRLCYYCNYHAAPYPSLFIGQKIDVAIVHKGW